MESILLNSWSAMLHMQMEWTNPSSTASSSVIQLSCHMPSGVLMYIPSHQLGLWSSMESMEGKWSLFRESLQYHNIDKNMHFVSRDTHMLLNINPSPQTTDPPEHTGSTQKQET